MVPEKRVELPTRALRMLGSILVETLDFSGFIRLSFFAVPVFVLRFSAR